MKRIFEQLYVQVLLGILLGVMLGVLAPQYAVAVKPLADAFIKLIKMMIPPIIFLTVVSGIASMRDLKSVGNIGGSALLYFVLTTTCALILGLLAANIFKLGHGMHVDPSTLDMQAVQAYIGQVQHTHDLTGFVLNIIPTTFFSAFTQGEILQVLFVAILFSLGLMAYGDRAEPILASVDQISKIFFKLLSGIMRAAPLAAFAAMAYTLGQYGVSSLVDLLELVLLFYLTCAFFIVGILGSILYFYCNVNIFKLLNYLQTEIIIVFSTSSSESVLPNIMEKMSALGCDPAVAKLVVPTGYSFNLDGTAIYLTLAALFIAQATGNILSFEQQLFLLLIMIVSSKGAAGITGSGFVVLASSLAAIDTIPVAGVMIILGVDRFMSDGRALTNVIGNAIATIIISKRRNALDMTRVREVLKNDKNTTR